LQIDNPFLENSYSVKVETQLLDYKTFSKLKFKATIFLEKIFVVDLLKNEIKLKDSEIKLKNKNFKFEESKDNSNLENIFQFCGCDYVSASNSFLEYTFPMSRYGYPEFLKKIMRNKELINDPHLTWLIKLKSSINLISRLIGAFSLDNSAFTNGTFPRTKNYIYPLEGIFLNKSSSLTLLDLLSYLNRFPNEFLTKIFQDLTKKEEDFGETLKLLFGLCISSIKIARKKVASSFTEEIKVKRTPINDNLACSWLDTWTKEKQFSFAQESEYVDTLFSAGLKGVLLKNFMAENYILSPSKLDETRNTKFNLLALGKIEKNNSLEFLFYSMFSNKDIIPEVKQKVIKDFENIAINLGIKKMLTNLYACDELVKKVRKNFTQLFL
jgi:hypothetical protein